jgi:hypothetical protein
MSGTGPVGGALRSTLMIAEDPRSMTAPWKRADDGTWGSTDGRAPSHDRRRHRLGWARERTCDFRARQRLGGLTCASCAGRAVYRREEV